MYHSITFDNTYNTWDNWHLIPTKRPHMGPPELDFLYQNELQYEPLDLLNIPGQEGINKQRQGSWEFAVVNGYRDWASLYTEIMTKLHGRIMTIAFEDDPGYYYRGRVSVTNWDSQESYSVITIEALCEPYKYGEDITAILNGRDNTFVAATEYETPAVVTLTSQASVNGVTIYGLSRNKITGASESIRIKNIVANKQYIINGRDKTIKEVESDGSSSSNKMADVTNIMSFPTVIKGNNIVSVVGTPSFSSDSVISMRVVYAPRYL